MGERYKGKEGEIIVDGKKLTYTSFKNYLDVPWGKSSVEIILMYNFNRKFQSNENWN